MIRVLNIEGRCCPRLCCDVCKEPIEHDGMARWDPYDPACARASSHAVHHAHAKGYFQHALSQKKLTCALSHWQ